AYSFWTILAVTLLYNLFFNPTLPLLDAITLSGVRRFDADYGKVRIWGSIVFILANMGGGVILLGYDREVILYALIAAMFLGAVSALALPRIGRKTAYVKSLETEVYRKSLMTNKRFLIVLGAAGLAQASHAFLYGFGSIYWQAIGMSGTMIGLFWAIGVVAEIILFQFSKPLLKRVSSTSLIALGCIGGIIRWALFPWVEGEILFLLLQILHGLSFGAAHIGLMHYIMESVPEDNIGAAQGVGYVLGGVVMGIAIFTSGPLYDSVGVYGFWAMAGLCLLGLALLFFGRNTEEYPDKRTA
ncbi:MAG: MFS transporter, partial [Salaquimonas sp.]